jgi:type IV pilus modification protein PilV
MNTIEPMGSRRMGRRGEFAGFSLIEVLVAVVVLAVGLLALAALQTSVTRSSAEAKARSVATRLAQERIEELLAFGSRTGAGVDASIPWWENLESGSDAIGESSDPDAPGGLTFERSWQIDYCSLSAAATDGSTTVACGVDAEDAAFARVRVNVTWVGPDGLSRTVALEDSISSMSPTDVAAALSDISSSRESPRVRLREKRLEGTIPIAIGDNQESASSDPQPAVFRENIARTQFEVIVYQRNDDEIIARRAFEYTVIGCECELTTATAATRSFEPAYWNGETYVPPREIVNVEAGRQVGRAILRNQDPDSVKELCTACCRDHHDFQLTTEEVNDDRFKSTRMRDQYGLTENVSRVLRRVDPFLPETVRLCRYTVGTGANQREVLVHPQDNPAECLDAEGAIRADRLFELSNYAPANGHNHLHFNPVLVGGRYEFRLATQPGDRYYEVCRFVRLDGIFRLTQDARLENLEVLRRRDILELAEGAEDNEYAKFAASFVDRYVDDALALAKGQPPFGRYPGNAPRYPLTPPSFLLIQEEARADVGDAFRQLLDHQAENAFLLPSNGEQLTARAIYVDPISEKALEGLDCIVNEDTESNECLRFVNRTKLELVPFFAINLTQLTGWDSMNTNVARMTLADLGNPFSRGLAKPESNGLTRVFAAPVGSNSGLTIQVPPNPEVRSASRRDDLYVATVAGTPPSLAPSVTFVVEVDRNVPTASNQDEVNPQLTASNGASNCRITRTQGKKVTWRCDLSFSGNGDIRFANYTGRRQECTGQGQNRICTTVPVNTLVRFSPAVAPPSQVTVQGNFADYSETTRVSFQNVDANREYAADVLCENPNCG